MSDVKKVTTAAFEREVLGSSLPVLVDFQTAWCPACRTLEPTLERLASELQGEVKVVSVDVEAEPELGDAFGIRSVPTIGVFLDGQLAHLQPGALPPRSLEALMRRMAELGRRDVA
jgi:thioredoxin 1